MSPINSSIWKAYWNAKIRGREEREWKREKYKTKVYSILLSFSGLFDTTVFWEIFVFDIWMSVAEVLAHTRMIHHETFNDNRWFLYKVMWLKKGKQ